MQILEKVKIGSQDDNCYRHASWIDAHQNWIDRGHCYGCGRSIFVVDHSHVRVSESDWCVIHDDFRCLMLLASRDQEP